MKLQDFPKADSYMKATYGISIADAGLTPEEWCSRYSEESYQEAVEHYAEKYDFDPIDAPWR